MPELAPEFVSLLFLLCHSSWLCLKCFLILSLARGVPGEGPDCHLPKEIAGFGPIPARILKFLIFIVALSPARSCVSLGRDSEGDREGDISVRIGGFSMLLQLVKVQRARPFRLAIA